MFYREFIEAAETEYRQWQTMSNAARTNPEMLSALQQIADITAGGQIKKLDESMKYYYDVAQHMRHAKIIKMSAEQCKVFMETPRVDGQDYARWMRLPFPTIWLALDGTFPFLSVKGTARYGEIITPNSLYLPLPSDDLPVQVKGVLLSEIPASKFKASFGERHDMSFEGEQPGVDTITDSRRVKLREGREIPMKDIDRVLNVMFVSPLPETKFNEDSAILLILKDGTMTYSKHDAFSERREMMITFIIHVVNFLASPSVKLMPREPDVALQKARQRRGKEPLPGWYEIVYRREYTPAKVVVNRGLYHHSFIYDVRGHFKTFTKGPMQGRVIWCPAHLRGLKNTLYKPKSYRTGQMQREAETLWEG
jgi:hypothetical protein